MGCCGCDNKSSAITAGIFGLIQSIFGLLFNAYFLNLYIDYPYNLDIHSLDERLFLLLATRDALIIIMILLALATILHSVWFISSIILLVGNASNNTFCICQWVCWTSFVIIGDILLPIILIASTLGSFIVVVNSMDQGSGISSLDIDLYKYYIILLFGFIKLGPITIITNICLNVFTNGRAYEINNPLGYVVGRTVTIIQGETAVPNIIHAGSGTVVTQPPIGYHSSGTSNPYYPRNVLMQPAVTFSTTTVPNSDCPETNGTEDVCNSLSDLLLPPKYSEDC